MIGWVWGLCAGGVSVPCTTGTDAELLPEQFHPDALHQMARQCNQGGGTVALTWGHHGPRLASNSDLDLLMRVVDLFGTPGLALEARLRDGTASRQALEQLEAGLVGVSLEFSNARSERIHRHGIGPLRLVSQARLRGIALVPRGSGSKAAYAACTAKGSRGASIGCSPALRDAVQHHAWRELTAQAKQMA